MTEVHSFLLLGSAQQCSPFFDAGWEIALKTMILLHDLQVSYAYDVFYKLHFVRRRWNNLFRSIR